MKIKQCQIRNFRGLNDINFDFKNNTCLIAGPNAIGKSTVLEAIRLNRALLLNRYSTEGQTVLYALGAASNPNQSMYRGGYFDFSAIARDPIKDIHINMLVQLDEHELKKIAESLHALALEYLRGSMGSQLQQDQSALTQFLSSKQGQDKFKEAEDKISKYVSTLNNKESIQLGLLISPDGQIRGENDTAQIVCGFLERSLPPQQGLFSFFSADRSLPAGEAAIQLGAGDSDNQIKSHIAEPHIKYQRLKTSIANSTLLKENIDKDFKIIFDEILPGKRLAGLQIGPIGNFRVSISEEGVDRPFDIDSLSSGEKGLILTFLLIRRAVVKGGVILIDEPELHLNPGVCRKLLHFFIDHCIKPHNLQAIICTHSAEILNSAYEREDCDIHHLKSPDNATPIYRGDFDEMFKALGRLGVSPAESFFYDSRVFVEGPHDEELLEEGFRSVLGDRCQITSLGGRKAIEAEIKNLQTAESEGRLDRLHCFIFDRDRDFTSLTNTPLVKVIQWDRYCLENYLINTQALYDVIKKIAKNVTLPDRGEFQNSVKELALEQIKPLAAREAYEKDRIRGPGLTNDDICDSFNEMRDILLAKLEDMKIRVSNFDLKSWKHKYLNDCEVINNKLLEEWDTKWDLNCNGKELLEKVCRKYSINCDRRELKKELVRHIRDQRSHDWQAVEKLLVNAVKQ